MRQQPEALENHAHLLAPERPQVAARQPQHVLPVDADGALGWLDQAVEMADERRLAGAGQAHDDEDFLPRNVKVDVHQADNVPVLGKQALLADTRFDARQRLGRRRPENLV